MRHTPSSELGPFVTTTVPTTPGKPSQRLRSSAYRGGDICTSYICRFAAQWLRPKLDETINPCEDFYGYVCGTHGGVSQLGQTGDLVRWMISMDLDFNSYARLLAIDPIETMIRGSLDLGVHAILFFRLMDTWFYHLKRVILLQFSGEEMDWLDARGLLSLKENIEQYTNLLQLYGVQPSRDTLLASRIVMYESRDRWVNPISKYTNGTYTAEDKVMVQQPALNVLVNILNGSVGENGIRYLVAWSIYRQLVKYTVPHMLAQGRTASDACYEHASKTMQLALLSSYFQAEPYPDVLPGRLFPSWIKTLSLSSHYRWADSTTWFYDETEVNAFYEYRTNLLVIPTAIITRPLYYDEGPPAINYGALGA
ncbi:hypothetical protein MRX96_054893, partial [Rhipicephalus microplus]